MKDGNMSYYRLKYEHYHGKNANDICISGQQTPWQVTPKYEYH